jgi:hypothetical protein
VTRKIGRFDRKPIFLICLSEIPKPQELQLRRFF